MQKCLAEEQKLITCLILHFTHEFTTFWLLGNQLYLLSKNLNISPCFVFGMQLFFIDSLKLQLSITDAFEPVRTIEHETIVVSFKCHYWLLKHEFTYHTNYGAIMDLDKLLGCDYFSKLQVHF